MVQSAHLEGNRFFSDLFKQDSALPLYSLFCKEAIPLYRLNRSQGSIFNKLITLDTNFITSGSLLLASQKPDLTSIFMIPSNNNFF